MSCSVEWQMFINAGVGHPSLPQNTGAGKDYARYAPTAATRFTDDPEEGVALPDDANCAKIDVLDNMVEYRVGATDVVAGEGAIWFANTSYVYENQRAFLENVSFIDASAASDIRVTWGRV